MGSLAHLVDHAQNRVTSYKRKTRDKWVWMWGREALWNGQMKKQYLSQKRELKRYDIIALLCDWKK